MGDVTSASADPPAYVSLSPGESVSFSLPGLGPAGYRWGESVEGPDGVVDLQWQRGRGPVRPVGAGAAEILEVRAQAPGRVRIHLAQRRPWERSRAPHAVHDVEVVVGTPPGSGRPDGPGPH